MPHPSTIPPDHLLARCTIRRQRRSGPGGQHRNKVETAVVIRHDETGIEGQASERRSQSENQRVALFRLRINLALEFRMTPDQPLAPSALWQLRCRNKRLSVSETHDDFPALLAEALDAIHASALDLPTAAAALNCTASQLLKLLKREPVALTALNALRKSKDLSPLR